MQRVYADIVIIASEKQRGNEAPFTYHGAPHHAIAVGSIVYVPLAQQTVIGVVITHTTLAPAFVTKEIISTTPFALSATQIALAQWMARHYHTSLATILGTFVTHAVVPPPTRQWQITDAGYNASLADLPDDERGALYVVRQHQSLSEDDIRDRMQLQRKTVATLRKWLSARGYITVSYIVNMPTIPASTIKYLCYVDHHKKLTAAQQRIVDALCAEPDNQLPLSTFGITSVVKNLLASDICRIVERDIANVPVRQAVTLSDAQSAVVSRIHESFGTHQPFLIEGVTGSGKTEVYFALIDHCINAGLQVLVLVPEIALTTQLAQRFSQRFPGRVGVVHGQITPAQRRQHWAQSLNDKLPIIIGPRSALYVPQPKLGLIIIDEEHDASYKSEFAPFIHARDAGIMYAKIANIPVVLGSATPSVELMYAATHAKITHARLPQRVDATGATLALPPVRIVDMRSEPCIDDAHLIGQTLADAMMRTLADNQQVLLLLNRRGNTGARICRSCGSVSRCHRCSTPMATHRAGTINISICHTCGTQRHPDIHCRECYHTDFIEYGSGTQRVVELVGEHFPEVPVLQWDRDTADSAQRHSTILAHATANPRAIIVGTQMIAKGLDLPNIRLVGVINTDLALHLPDFRAAERTYQLLTQVAGRAGRRSATAQVIMQSYQPDNYAIYAAARYQSDDFYAQELKFRQQLGYPPFQRLIKLLWTHQNPRTCEQHARAQTDAIQTIIATEFPDSRLIGPTPSFFARIRNHYRWQALILTTHGRQILTRIRHHHHAIVDVDPVSLL